MELNEYDGAWITTFTGHKFHFLNPQPEEVFIEDIGHALGNLCRFGGHSKKFYSVAEHCLLVSDMLPTELELSGLMHDASEAYVIDLPRPIKYSIQGYRDVEDRIAKVIQDRFGLTTSDLIHQADNIALSTEASSLMANTKDWALLSVPINTELLCLSPMGATEAFMKRFYYLCPRYKQGRLF